MQMSAGEDRGCDKMPILIVGGAPDAVRHLRALLEQNGYEVSTTSNGNNAHLQITDTEAQAVLLACQEPPKQKEGATTALETAQNVKGRLVSGVGEEARLALTPTRKALHGDYAYILGDSPQVVDILQKVEDVAATNATVLIQGETGTGKELVARALHRNSPRSAEEMAIVNCAAIPEQLLESELFGHEKGAYTDAITQHIGKFERAHNSTLFFDEIGEMPLRLQPKLLRAIQERQIERLDGTRTIPLDIRIVAATNRDLQQDVENGTFREDLYYRLNVVCLSLPPLRERREDIRMLAAHFVQKHCQDSGQPLRKIASETLAILENYPWPGNIRSLENAMLHASIFAKSGVILPEHLPEEIRCEDTRQLCFAAETPKRYTPHTVNLPTRLNLKEVEKVWILQTLTRLDGNRTKTAKALGMSLSSLYNKLNNYTEESKT